MKTNEEIFKLLIEIKRQLLEQNERIYTFKAAAEYMGISESHLYKLTCKSEIRHSKPGGKKIFFRKSDLDQFLMQNTVEAI